MRALRGVWCGVFPAADARCLVGIVSQRARFAYPSLRSQFTQFWRCVPTEPERRAMNKNITVVLLLVLAAGCSTNPQDGAYPPMDPTRKGSRQGVTTQIETNAGGDVT